MPSWLNPKVTRHFSLQSSLPCRTIPSEYRTFYCLDLLSCHFDKFDAQVPPNNQSILQLFCRHTNLQCLPAFLKNLSNKQCRCSGSITCKSIGWVYRLFDQSANGILQTVLLYSLSTTYSMCLTTVTPSFVILGSFWPFSITTFLPRGPKVMAAILATSAAVLTMISLH